MINVFIGSRLTVFEREQAWNLYLPFLFFTIVSGSDSHLEALQTKTSGDYHLLFFGVNILNAVCFEAIILTGPRQSEFLTIIDKPQPDGARNGQARNPKIDVYADGTPRTPTGVIKSGITEAAVRAVASHTGTLAGDDAVLNAAFRRAGVLRVNTIADLFHM